jgi:hypothetical protein
MRPFTVVKATPVQGAMDAVTVYWPGILHVKVGLVAVGLVMVAPLGGLTDQVTVFDGPIVEMASADCWPTAISAGLMVTS